MISINRLKEITECGFYCSKNDVERIYIYEVIKNTDEKWLKENPEATLLIDGWIYDHTDYDDRKVYCTGGNLNAICNDFANCKVYKIEDTKYKKYGNCGQFLIEDKPIYNEQHKAKEQELNKAKQNTQDTYELYQSLTESFNILQGEKIKLEQENKRLKDIIETKLEDANICNTALNYINDEYIYVKRQLDQLKSENDEFKKQTCGLRPELKYIIDKTCCKYNINAKYYHEKIVEIINNLDKYNQTLTEIKEIIKQGVKIHDDIIISKQILQKFREVIPDEN